MRVLVRAQCCLSDSVCVKKVIITKNNNNKLFLATARHPPGDERMAHLPHVDEHRRRTTSDVKWARAGRWSRGSEQQLSTLRPSLERRGRRRRLRLTRCTERSPAMSIDHSQPQQAVKTMTATAPPP